MLTDWRSKSPFPTALLTSALCCAVGVAALGCGSSKGGGTGTAGVGAAGSASAGNGGAAGATMDAGTTAGAGGTAGASGSAGAAGTADAAGSAGSAGARDAATDGTGSVALFKNYEVTGTWPKQPVAIAQTPGQLKYTKIIISDQFLAESCAIGDYNNDGVPDVSSGRSWYEGTNDPTTAFKTSHPFRDGHGPLPRTGDGPEINTGVSDDWADYPLDVDGDGWTDIIDVAQPDVDEATYTNPKFGTVQVHATAVWYQNPGSAAALAGDPKWVSHIMNSDVRLEEHGLIDVNGDGFPEIYGACKACTPADTKGYYQRDPATPTAPWTFHSVTIPYVFPFGGTGWLHGLGGGDVNGDGLPDLVEKGGAWLQQRGGTWNQTVCVGPNLPMGCGWVKQGTTLLPQGFSKLAQTDTVGNVGPSHMYAVDMDKDGCADVVAADWAYGVGLFWYQQGKTGTTCNLSFTRYQFMGDSANDVPADPVKWGAGFTEPTALQVVDMDGDGRPDVISGKMRFAHPNGYGDPDSNGTPYLVVFKNIAAKDPNSGGPITLKPVQVDPDPGATPGDAGTPDGGMGVGRQIAIGHANLDGIMDICVATKVGLAVFLGQ